MARCVCAVLQLLGVLVTERQVPAPWVFLDHAVDCSSFVMFRSVYLSSYISHTRREIDGRLIHRLEPEEQLLPDQYRLWI